MTVGYDIVVKCAWDKYTWTFASLDKREGLKLLGYAEPA
jgi:hypothetical protein